MVDLDNALDTLRTISCTNEASGASGPTNEESEEPLPPGWEVRTHQPTGKKYYINHNTRKTQWDPPQRYSQMVGSYVIVVFGRQKQSLLGIRSQNYNAVDHILKN